ncbi:MAG TPA: ABC transporter ATP-binding protein [Candidatus Binatia bacterium]|nr:ABC transporter ATP-binding protein [Candidatus Binatia bacterium]
MSNVVIRTENLSKLYQIGKLQERRNLRGTIQHAFTTPVRSAQRLWSKPSNGDLADETIWAVKDVNLEVKRGEVLGVVGRNGAGKSTLLKILSRITFPTSGSAEINGRLGSLLEVGTGFQPELSGRDNVYLNGAILGMRKAEIDRKLDEIVAFAEVEKFIDTPVKQYSSGMYVRLAFSVAAHLEPDILLVDEVLAVGDARFYSKSINKMRALNAQGMTIVLVTHHVWLVQTVCSRAICLEKGSIVCDGEPVKVIALYSGITQESGNGVKTPSLDLEDARIHSFQICPQENGTGVMKRLSEGGLNMTEASPYSGMKTELEVEVFGFPRIKFFVRVTSPDGLPYFTVYSDLVKMPECGRIKCEASIPHLMLMPGDYSIWSGVCSEEGEKRILTEKYLPFVVRGEAQAESRYSFFWNRADWQIQDKD